MRINYTFLHRISKKWRRGMTGADIAKAEGLMPLFVNNYIARIRMRDPVSAIDGKEYFPAHRRGLLSKGQKRHNCILTRDRVDNLLSLMPTTKNAVLAGMFGVSSERIRQIRKAHGIPSTKTVINLGTASRKIKAAEDKARAAERRLKRAALVARLRRSWAEGDAVSVMAKAEGLQITQVWALIAIERGKNRKSFPLRIHR